MALVFEVRRSEVELVRPTKATLNEVKSLSDWDDRIYLREWVSCMLFYNSDSTSEVDPREKIKRALGEALVYYYPLAGRIKEEGPEKRLVVDCTGEGVSFVSADADVMLDQLGTKIRPLLPCMSELLYNKPTKWRVADVVCPIFVMQVTRLACGGFILAFSFNHVMCDMAGATQFVTAISELALGGPAPSVLPVWQRQLLNARGTAFMKATPTKSDDAAFMKVAPTKSDGTALSILASCQSGMTYRSFFFGAQELEAIRAHLSPLLGDHFTAFELISSCVLHCQVISLAPEEKEVCAAFAVNARSKFVDPPLPWGYYGNASFLVKFTLPTESFHDLRYVVEEVRKAKVAVTDAYLRSCIEERAKPPGEIPARFYIISDISRLGLSCLDFGWGKPLYAGTTGDDKAAHIRSFIVASTNSKGEEGRLITLYMSNDAMDKFEHKLHSLLGST